MDFGTRTRICSRVMLLAAGITILNSRGWAQTLDQYGGSKSIPCSAGAKPHFYTEKINNRWWLCTPAGNAFFMKGVYNVDMNDTTPDYQGVALSSVIATKYASGATTNSTLNWAAQTVKRLQSWGFNTLGEYASAYTWPVFTDSRWGTPDSTIPAKMPYIVLIRPSWYSLFNQQGFASGPVKDLVNGIKTSVFSFYRSQSADFWDPRFAEWFQAALAKDVTIRAGYAGPNNDYLVGFDIDESDNIQGYGAGPDFLTADISVTGFIDDHTNPHLGWFVLVTAATQSATCH